MINNYAEKVIDNILKDKIHSYKTTYEALSDFKNDFIDGKIGIIFMGHEFKLQKLYFDLNKMELEYNKHVYCVGFTCYRGVFWHKGTDPYNIKWVWSDGLYIYNINYEFIKHDLIAGLHICETKNKELLYYVQTGNNGKLFSNKNRLISLDDYDYYLNNIYDDKLTIVNIYEYINDNDDITKTEMRLIGKTKIK